jgi:hypothetical protein
VICAISFSRSISDRSARLTCPASCPSACSCPFPAIAGSMQRTPARAAVALTSPARATF